MNHAEYTPQEYEQYIEWLKSGRETGLRGTGAPSTGGSALVVARSGGRAIHIQREAHSRRKTEPPLRQSGDQVGFSVSSRRRLQKLFSSLKRDAQCVFITLTYHRVSPTCDEARKDLHAFTEAVRRKLCGVRWGFIWRLERQSRGTPHFHILLYGTSYIPRHWVKRTWNRITGDSIEHRDVGAWIEAVEDAGKAARYVGKYLCKKDQDNPTVGRPWGVRNRKNLPVAPLDAHLVVSDHVARKVIHQFLTSWGVELDVVPYGMGIRCDRPDILLRQIMHLARRARVGP